jgi:hypothetical protein
MPMKVRRTNSKGALSTVMIVAIVLIAMVIATVVIFFFLPTVDDWVNPGPCGDTCFVETNNEPYLIIWEDCEHLQRQINYYPNGPDDAHSHLHWQYNDGWEGFTSTYFATLHDLRTATEAEYQAGKISEESWHWFDCTAEAIA